MTNDRSPTNHTARASFFSAKQEALSRLAVLPALEQHAVEHGEDGLMLGLGEAGEALELPQELRGRPALAGVRAGDAEQHIGRQGEERGELGHEGDGEPEPADLVVGEGLLRDAHVRGDRLLGETGLLAQVREAAAELRGELPVGGRHVRLPCIAGSTPRRLDRV